MTNLRGFDTAEEEVGSSNSKIYGAAIVAAAIGAFVVFGFATGMWNAPPPAKPATFNVASNAVAPLPPVAPAAVPPTELGTPAPAVPAPVEMAPVQPVRHAPTIRAARAHVRAPAAVPQDEISPVVAPVTSPVDIAPPPAPLETLPVQTAPVQPEPTPPAQPQL